jgi:glycosyltransferase involved in cell wall biosynthesis
MLERSMHVLQVGKYYPPYRGGIETVVEQLSRGLVRRGIEVTVLVSNDSRDATEQTIDGVRVIRLARVASLNSQPLNPRLVSVLRSLKFDVLHVHTPNPIGVLAVLAAGRHAPIVVTHHSDIVRQRMLGGLATAAHSLLYSRARAIIAPTPKHIEYSNVLPRFAARCRVIHLPIDPNPYAAAGPLPIERLPVDFLGKPLALFVGRLVYYKGVDVLLRALAMVPNLHLAIVGVGPLARGLLEQTKALGLANRVAFLDALSEANLLGLYKTSNFLVLPSVAPSEAFGMVQLEAMAAGRAVISTDLRSGVPYVNQHGKTGLIVPPNDAPALASAMRQLVDFPAYALELGTNGEARVREEFGLERVVDQHVTLYTEVRVPIVA